MRKLNKKNKIYIWALSLATLIVIVLLVIFIVNKIKVLTFKYEINPNSYTYDENRELVVINEKTTLKRTALNEYYILNEDKTKTNLYEYPVIYNKDTRTVTIFGTFYEVLSNGDVKKYKNINEITPGETLRIFKITDRRYLVIAKNIKDTANFSTEDYLLIDLDTAGNAYLFNNIYNIKTFEVLKLVSDDITFNVNNEKINFGENVVDLAKINGSTNNYKDVVKETNETSTGGEVVISNVIEEQTEEKINDNIYEDNNSYEETSDSENEVKIAPKTTILEATASADKIDINYLVFDPYNEYTNIYFTISSSEETQSYTLSKQDSSYNVTGLLPSTKYKLDFYYSYLENDEKKSVNFDTKEVTTKDVTGKITLEKVDENIVQYKVRVDDYIVDSQKDNYCDVITYLNDEVVDTKSKIGLDKLMGDGYSLKSNVNYTKGSKIIISLENCKYNGKDISINAKYKFKI